MSQRSDLSAHFVQDTLRNPWGGPHWLRTDAGFTPVPDVHRKLTAIHHENPPAPEEDPERPFINPDRRDYGRLELEGLPPEEKAFILQLKPHENAWALNFLRKNGYLPLHEEQGWDMDVERMPHAERFRLYLERKMKRFGRKPRENWSGSQVLAGAAVGDPPGYKEAVEEEFLQDEREYLGRLKAEENKNLKLYGHLGPQENGGHSHEYKQLSYEERFSLYGERKIQRLRMPAIEAKDDRPSSDQGVQEFLQDEYDFLMQLRAGSQYLRQFGNPESHENDALLHDYELLPYEERYPIIKKWKMQQAEQTPQESDPNFQVFADIALEAVEDAIDRARRGADGGALQESLLNMPLNLNVEGQVSRLDGSITSEHASRPDTSSQIIKQGYNSPEWEQDLATYLRALVPEGDAQQEYLDLQRRRDDEVAANTGPPLPWDWGFEVDTALGKLLHSSIDLDAASDSQLRYRSRPASQKWSDVARRPTRKIYVSPNLRSVRLLTREGNISLPTKSSHEACQESKNELGSDPLLAENGGHPFGYEPEPDQFADLRDFPNYVLSEHTAQRFAFRNPYTDTYLTKRECQLIWAISRKVRTAPHSGLRCVHELYNRRLMDLIFHVIIQDQRQMWWVKAEGGHHIPESARLDCRYILKALHETPVPKFCSLKFEVDMDPPGGYWDRNANFAFGRWIDLMAPDSIGGKPSGLLERSKSDPSFRVEMAILRPFLDETGRFWDRGGPKRTTFIDLGQSDVLNAQHAENRNVGAQGAGSETQASSSRSADRVVRAIEELKAAISAYCGD